MAAALVQKAETTADSASTIVRAYTSNVTAGNLLTVEVTRYTQSVDDPILVGDLAKTAGTATIGTITLDASANNTTPLRAAIAIFSIPCTGTGSLTWTVTGNAGDYWWINVSEWSGTASTKEASNSNTGNSTTPDSGNVTSAGAGLFIALEGSGQGVDAAITEDGAFTLLNEEEAGNAHQTGNSCYRIVTTGTTDSGSWTLAGGTYPWAAVVAVYAEVGAGATNPGWMTSSGGWW